MCLYIGPNCSGNGKKDCNHFLALEKGIVGTIGGGKAKRSGKIDIAVMQSLSRQGETSELVEQYGHVIVDECHHLSAISFEALLKRVKAKYGHACSLALGQLARIEATATQFEGQEDARVACETFLHGDAR